MGKVYGNYDESAFIGGPPKEIAKHHKLGTKHNDKIKYNGPNITVESTGSGKKKKK